MKDNRWLTLFKPEHIIKIIEMHYRPKKNTSSGKSFRRNTNATAVVDVRVCIIIWTPLSFSIISGTPMI